MENKLGKNRKSPKNEEDFINAYTQLNPSAKKADELDVAAVTTKGGVKGHGLMAEKYNRSHDDNFHRVQDFISDSELRKQMKSTK